MKGNAMTVVQAFLLGVMVAWTPSMLLLAVVLWHSSLPRIPDDRAYDSAGGGES